MKKWKRILGIALMIAGVIFLGLYFSADHILRLTSRPAVIEQISAEKMQENNLKQVENHNEAVSNTEVISTLISIPNIDNENVIGQIFSPEIEMNMAITKGITQSNLLLGAATMKLEQTMGEGNYALAGHYNYTKNVLFNRILDVPIDTNFYITDKVKIYHYRIVSRDVYPEDAFYMIEDSEADKRGKPLLTLMTCNRSNEQGRIFAVGELIEVIPYDQGFFSSDSIKKQ